MTKAESWVLMALQQCKAIVHLLAPPEVLTIGHNPYRNPSVVDAHVAIPSKFRPKFMSELLAGVTEEEPMQRWGPCHPKQAPCGTRKGRPALNTQLESNHVLSSSC